MTARARLAARAPRKGYLAYKPKRLPPYSQSKLSPRISKGFRIRSEYGDLRRHRFALFPLLPASARSGVSIELDAGHFLPATRCLRTDFCHPYQPNDLHPCSRFSSSCEQDRPFGTRAYKKRTGTWRFTAPKPASAADVHSMRVLALSKRGLACL